MTRLIQMPNGLRIVAESIPSVRSIAFGIYVKNGSRNEKKETNGISHFIEHMFFKGTEKRQASDIADEMDAIGGQMNALTSKEYTCYYTRTLDSHFDIALDILSDMFFNSKFDDQEIQKERGVIIEEINMYDDLPDELVHEILQSSIWQDSALGYPILGDASTISTFNNSTFKAFYHSNYHPHNTVIALAGNFEIDEAAKKIEQYFGQFDRQHSYEKPSLKTEYKPCVVTKEKDVEQVHISFGFPSIPLGSEEAYDLAVLNTIFGSGMSSRLFQKIREEHGLAYSVYSANSSYTDTGLYYIYAGLNRSHTEKTIQLVLEEIKRLEDEPIGEEQLARTKEQLKSNYLLSQESTSTRMSNLGRGMIMLNRILTPEEIIRKIESVTTERIDDLVKRIFKLEQMSFSAVGNIGGFNFEEILHR